MIFFIKGRMKEGRVKQEKPPGSPPATDYFPPCQGFYVKSNDHQVALTLFCSYFYAYLLAAECRNSSSRVNPTSVPCCASPSPAPGGHPWSCRCPQWHPSPGHCQHRAPGDPGDRDRCAQSPLLPAGAAQPLPAHHEVRQKLRPHRES